MPPHGKNLPALTWPTAQPVAALCVLRTAVGWRALQLALLVVGLSALAFLCGEQARAAEGLPMPTALIAEVSASAPTVKSTHVVTRVSERSGRAATRFRTLVRTQVRPDAWTEARVPVRLSVSLPVRLPAALDLPVVSDLSRPPALPGVPSLPGVPGVPALPSSPVGMPPVGSAGTVVVPSPLPLTSPLPPSSGGHGTVARGTAHVGTGAGRMIAAASETPAYGPASFVTGGSERAGHRGAPAHGGTSAVPSPVSRPAQQGPDGDPDGVPASDSGVSRHGDAQAVVTPFHRPVLWPALGGAEDSDVVETRDRYRDVPVFPG